MASLVLAEHTNSTLNEATAKAVTAAAQISTPVHVLIAGADCGFATFAARPPTVAPSVVWAKFRSMAKGAAIASERLWK